jgi:hypothetical protein
MMSPGPKKWEAAAAAGVAVLRAVTLEPSRLWRDWVLLLAIYWIFTVFRWKSPGWPVVTVTAMAYLLGIAVLGQLPHVLAVLGT